MLQTNAFIIQQINRGCKMKKNTFMTTIKIETDYDPTTLGSAQLVMDACTGSARIVSKETSLIMEQSLTEKIMLALKSSLEH